MARILHLGKFYPPDRGGIEIVTQALARGAAASGHHVDVICFTTSRSFSDSDGPVKVMRMPRLFTLASQPVGLRYLFSGILASNRSDLLHLHMPNMLAALIALVSGRRARVIVHWHSDIIGKSALHLILAPLERALLRRSDRIICTSQDYADASSSLKKFRAKVCVVPLGVPDRPDISASAGPDAQPQQESSSVDVVAQFLRGRRFVLAVGRLVLYKGYSTLIDATSRLPDDVATVIVGDGPLRSTLAHQISERGLSDRVLLVGNAGTGLLHKLMATAHVFCLPSVERSEAFGVVLIEAMAWSLPIVATRISGSGVPWVNQDGESGINVMAGNAETLADAIQLLFSDAAMRERLAAGSRRRYEAMFRLEQSVESTLQVYRTVIEGQWETGLLGRYE